MIKRLKQLRFISLGAGILTGFLAGGTIEKLLIGLPAWKFLDIFSWANYSRHADLGNGVFIYPFEAIGSFILLLAYSIYLFKFKSKFNQRTKTIHVYLATSFSLLGLLLTFFAAPNMLHIKYLNDPVLLQGAFDRFYFWSIFRGIAHVLSFIFYSWGIINTWQSIPL